MDPNFLKHPAVILAKMRNAIEPSLVAAGFSFDDRNKPSVPLHLFLDYSRQESLFRLSWDRRDSNEFLGFKAEFLTAPDGYRLIAVMDLSDMCHVPQKEASAILQTRMDSFIAAVVSFLNSVGRAGPLNPTS